MSDDEKEDVVMADASSPECMDNDDWIEEEPDEHPNPDTWVLHRGALVPHDVDFRISNVEM